jgi:hypothetical protein
LQKELEVKEKACNSEGDLRSIHGALETGLSGSGRATGECWGPVGEAFWISFGICAKRKSKGKRKLEDGPECVMGEDFKESKSMTKGCTMEQCAKGGKWL